MQLQFVGSGDAFGSGGRFNTCFHVVGAEGVNFLLDCGATSLVALNRLGTDLNALNTIVVTHFHGDHFGGLPFFVIHAQLVAKRRNPLALIGPPGLAARYERAMDTAFPSFPPRPARFPLSFTEIPAGEACEVGGMRITAFPVVHSEAAGPCYGYRIEENGKVLAYSGDTEWTESLVDIGRAADLFVCEAYTRTTPVKGHTDLATLEHHLDRIGPKRLVLTHMSAEMLEAADQVPHDTARDGRIITF